MVLVYWRKGDKLCRIFILQGGLVGPSLKITVASLPYVMVVPMSRQYKKFERMSSGVPASCRSSLTSSSFTVLATLFITLAGYD